MKKPFQKFSRIAVISLAIAIGSLIIGLGMHIALAAWTPPLSAPPEGDIAAPLNISKASQYKEGSLLLGGAASPDPYRLYVMGAEKVTGDLEIQGNILPITGGTGGGHLGSASNFWNKLYLKSEADSGIIFNGGNSPTFRYNDTANQFQFVYGPSSILTVSNTGDVTADDVSLSGKLLVSVATPSTAKIQVGTFSVPVSRNGIDVYTDVQSSSAISGTNKTYEPSAAGVFGSSLYGRGVMGTSYSTSLYAAGVMGESETTNGVYATTRNPLAYGIYAGNEGGGGVGGYAGYFQGSVRVEGNILEVMGDVEVGWGLTVDTDTLFVNSISNRVGIGTTTPEARLEVAATGSSVAAFRAFAGNTSGTGSGNGSLTTPAAVYAQGGNSSVDGWNFGVYALAGISSGSAYTTAVYGKTSDATSSYAGYFVGPIEIASSGGVYGDLTVGRNATISGDLKNSGGLEVIDGSSGANCGGHVPSSYDQGTMFICKYCSGVPVGNWTYVLMVRLGDEWKSVASDTYGNCGT
ncbi:MAG: hypothetical protein COT24_05695 [Candidatus Kerfeldbacteria bacterium CG08_land_8_20_14_0_20_40_16]|uniref:Uncharacterized protein n=1 Tax=Candidatus Kerfeldbacteria bacterium CG08_land_8_20_14_0_20_40_16 TaxID=2014244 RepID=A0A2H0YU50_9BACT|nr:MAG: hypothetical protein COT24_05695 [Candidatus Kerfeldbacteria bacterium CG08_land_8_20_14_0_20_40_16]